VSQIESLSQIEEKLNNLSLKANNNISNASTHEELDHLRVSLLGKKGDLSIILKTMGQLSAIDRPIVGQKANLIKINLQTTNGNSYSEVLSKYDNGSKFLPTWKVSKGTENLKISQDGTVTAIKPGDATIEAKIPGLAAKSGFLFIKALGQVGFYVDGAINWDIAGLVGAFGLTLLLSQVLSSQGMPANPQQSTANKITPVMITGMFLFFPLPAGVLLYMVVANIFQAFQTFLLNKEALPENLQKILDQQLSAKNEIITTSASTISDKRLPFEPNSKK